MKVLIIGPFPPPIDGCSFANKVLLRNLEARKIKTGIINTNTDVIGKDQGHQFSLQKSVLFIKNYTTIYKIFSCDVVYFTPGQTFYGVMKYAPFISLCILLKKPFVIHLHGNYLGTEYASLKGFKKDVFQFLISHATAAIVLTSSLRKNFDGLLPDNKISVVPNFVESSLYERRVVKRTDKMRILYLSNLMTEKGIIELLDALIALAKKEIAFEATIAGSMEVGIQEEVTVRLRALEGKVQYVGVVTGEAKIEKLVDANVFILPTYYKMEGLPVSLLEAMATGNIIVTTAHAGIPDVIGEGNGFLIQPRSSRAIEEAFEKLSCDVKGMVSRFSEANISYARETFTEENYTDKILATLYASTGSRRL